MALIYLSAVDGCVRDIEINPPSRCDRHNSFSVPRSEESPSKKRIHFWMVQMMLFGFVLNDIVQWIRCGINPLIQLW